MGNLWAPAREAVASQEEELLQPAEVTVQISIGHWLLSDFVAVSSQWVEEDTTVVTVPKQTSVKDFVAMIWRERKLEDKQSAEMPLFKISLDPRLVVEASLFDLTRSDPVTYLPFNETNKTIVHFRIFDKSTIKLAFAKPDIPQDTFI
jgi:hypothetical protein